jgi:hypothetical protein
MPLNKGGGLPMAKWFENGNENSGFKKASLNNSLYLPRQTELFYSGRQLIKSNRSTLNLAAVAFLLPIIY